MTAATTTLLRSLLPPFYRENGGLVLFLLFIMFAAVGRANDTGLLEYHYALIQGMLRNTDMLLLVFSLWGLYTIRSVSFISRTLRQPAFAFLHEYARMAKPVLFARLALLQTLFFLPVLIYAAIIVVIAFRLQFQVTACGIMAVLAGLCFGVAGWHTFLFSRPGFRMMTEKNDPSLPVSISGYWQVMYGYLVADKKTLFAFIKIFSAGMLWAVLRQLSPGDDLRMPVLFYSFGLFGHGVLLFNCREMEERELGFYRGLPVSLYRRYLQYARFCGLIFLPEAILLISMTPGHVSPGNGILFYLLGYGVLMLLYSLLFVKAFTKGEFLKLCCGIFFAIFTGVLAGALPVIAGALWFLSGLLFSRFYYRFDQRGH